MNLPIKPECSVMLQFTSESNATLVIAIAVQCTTFFLRLVAMHFKVKVSTNKTIVNC